ncbi:hypothetical protein [Flavimaribacter sediminis]|nr:hypothetical protein [Flavimaribacter sediminis]
MQGMTEEIASRHYFIGCQVNYLRLPSGEVDPDITIGKLEMLQEFLSSLTPLLPRLTEVGVRNASPGRQPLHEVYSVEMIIKVRQLFAPDIHEFGYVFPNSEHNKL